MVRRYVLLRDVCLFLGCFSVVLAPFAFSVSPLGFILFLVDGVAYFLLAVYFQVWINREKF
jgi:ABC-type polysaccharide/polyol phosphate export permease